MVVQEDTIFVSGMGPDTTEDEIANHFGAIGIIKVSAILAVGAARKANSIRNRLIRLRLLSMFTGLSAEGQAHDEAEDLAVPQQGDAGVQGRGHNHVR